MVNQSTWFKSVDLLQMTMDAALLRRQVLSDNIANANTPNFKRSEISFEAQLGRALASEQRPQLPLQRNQPEHFEPFQKIDYRQVKARRSLDYLSVSKNNGNNVDIQAEGAALLTNNMRYELLAEMLRYQFGQLRSVLA